MPLVGIGSLRLRQLQPRTLADVVCCPSLCVLTASSHRFNSAAVLEARLADGERIGADTLRLLHSRFDAARGMPPVLRRALIQIHESRGAAQREQTNDLRHIQPWTADEGAWIVSSILNAITEHWRRHKYLCVKVLRKAVAAGAGGCGHHGRS